MVLNIWTGAVQQTLGIQKDSFSQGTEKSLSFHRGNPISSQAKVLPFTACNQILIKLVITQAAIDEGLCL
jgi:hypothetical protein